MNENILVIHQGALGDVILSFPALRSLKQEKDASVTLLCKDQVGRIACELGVVDAHFPVERACFASLFATEITSAAKDLINPFEIVVLIGFSDKVEFQIRKNYGRQTYRITPRPPAEDETHVAIHIVKQMQVKGVLTNSKDIAFHVNSPMVFSPSYVRTLHITHGTSLTNKRTSTNGVPTVKKIESAQNENLLLIHPGAGSQRKRWALDNFIELAGAMKQMNFTETVFLIGPAESDLLALVKSRVQGRFQICPVEDLSEVMTVMKASRCFVGNDSGLAHLAAFLGVPAVVIFGPSSPQRWSPLGPATKVLRGEANCAPCFEVAKQNCEDPQCLNRVSVETAVEAVKEVGVVRGHGK